MGRRKKDEDVLEQARAGANVAVLVDGGRLAPFVKEFGIMGAPYLVDNFDQVLRLQQSALFKGWVEKLRGAANLQVLSFDWFQGHRHMLTNSPVKVPADLKGVRVRTPGAPVWLETVRAMGATPTGMPWSEVYSALQTKVPVLQILRFIPSRMFMLGIVEAWVVIYSFVMFCGLYPGWLATRVDSADGGALWRLLRDLRPDYDNDQWRLPAQGRWLVRGRPYVSSL